MSEGLAPNWPKAMSVAMVEPWGRRATKGSTQLAPTGGTSTFTKTHRAEGKNYFRSLEYTHDELQR